MERRSGVPPFRPFVYEFSRWDRSRTAPLEAPGRPRSPPSNIAHGRVSRSDDLRELSLRVTERPLHTTDSGQDDPPNPRPKIHAGRRAKKKQVITNDDKEN